MALKLEGITRNTGKHAGGVVISPTKITDFSAVMCDADGTGRVAQYDKDDVESAGLVKFDFLGLKTLTMLDEAVKLVNVGKTPDDDDFLDMSTLPLDDKATYKYLPDHNLPYHGLEGSGYDSVGDWHSTKKVTEVESREETRNAGHQRECGLHEDLPEGYDFEI